MRIALLSDIHANLQALEACLAHARAVGVDQYGFLGDYVGYGADAEAVVDIVREHVDRGAWAVMGNHDEAVERDARYMNDSAKAAIDWARSRLSDAQKAFLAALPLTLMAGDACMVHGTADAPDRWKYVDSAGAAARSSAAAGKPYTFSGHVHEQRLFFRIANGSMSILRPTPGVAIPARVHRKWLALVGSAGQPRDGNPAAAYAVLDTARQEITFFRVAYDHHEAASRIRRAGLPESLAWRLESGV